MPGDRSRRRRRRACDALVLEEPLGLAFDSHGNLYIADRDHDAIRKVDTNGIITTVAGTGVNGATRGDGGLATQAQLHRPLTVAFDAAGNMFIDDENNRRVRMVDHRTGSPRRRDGQYRWVVRTGGPATRLVDGPARGRLRARRVDLRLRRRVQHGPRDRHRTGRSFRRLGTAWPAASRSTNLVGRCQSRDPVGAYTFDAEATCIRSRVRPDLRVDDHGTRICSRDLRRTDEPANDVTVGRPRSGAPAAFSCGSTRSSQRRADGRHLRWASDKNVLTSISLRIYTPALFSKERNGASRRVAQSPGSCCRSLPSPCSGRRTRMRLVRTRPSTRTASWSVRSRGA